MTYLTYIVLNIQLEMGCVNPQEPARQSGPNTKKRNPSVDINYFELCQFAQQHPKKT